MKVENMEKIIYLFYITYKGFSIYKICVSKKNPTNGNWHVIW